MPTKAPSLSPGDLDPASRTPLIRARQSSPQRFLSPAILAWATTISVAFEPAPAAAQREWVPRKQTIQMAPDLLFRRLGKPEGLPELHVRAIAQDPDGFVWMGGAQSLARYDGREIVVKRAPDDPADGELTSGFITSMASSSDGGLWIGTGDGGLNYYDPESDRFEAYQHDPDDPNSLPSDGITALVEVNGTLWVGTTGGLGRLDVRSRSLQRIAISTETGNTDRDHGTLSQQRGRPLDRHRG